MALGRKDLRYINDRQSNLSGLNATVKDCWNSFRYVSENLEEWADETVIGNEVKINSQKLSDALKQTYDKIENLQAKVSKFVERQKSINE